MRVMSRFILLLGIMVCSMQMSGQSWPSPEIEQMYKTAREYMMQGKLQQAIVTYRQAIQLAPEQMILHRDLGRAYYLSGNSDQAEEILEPVLKSGEGDEQVYQVMASIQAGKGGKKKAKNTLQKGIERYAGSGILHHDLGKLYEEENEPEAALTAWLNGIEADPGYHLNYYQAARAYYESEKPIWTIVYGEIFVTMEQHTPRSFETREMVLNAYKKIFYSVPQGDIPRYSKNAKQVTGSNFESTLQAALMKLSPVMSDGISTENLTMLRTRLAMDWAADHAAQYPFSLFSFYDKMLRNGYFETYNQWFFGKVENAQQHEAWLKFHADAMPAFEAWLQQNKIKPVSRDFYNDKSVSGLFARKKDSKR
jgi:Tfp pilus assembly protein PilF